MVIEPKDVWSMVGFILYYPRQKMSLLYLVLYVVLGGYVKYFLCRKVTSKGILMYTKVGLFHFLCSVLSPLR